MTAGPRSAAPAAAPDGPPPAAWVYLLRCGDGSLYCGWTVDLAARVAAHAAGRGSRYTRSRLPVELALALPQPTRTAARRGEVAVKALTRAEKIALVAGSRAVAERVEREADPVDLDVEPREQEGERAGAAQRPEVGGDGRRAAAEGERRAQGAVGAKGEVAQGRGVEAR